MEDGLQDRHAALTRIRLDQDGLYTVAQARAVGFSHSTLRRWVTSGRARAWNRVVRSDVALPTSWRRRVRAAVLSLGPDAVVTGESAARVHGLDVRCPGPIRVAVPRATTQRPVGVRVHRPTQLPPSCIVDGLRIARMPAVLLSLAHHRDLPTIEDLVADAVRRRLVTLGDVESWVEASGPSVAGRGRLRAAVARLGDPHPGSGQWSDGQGNRRSPLERRLARLLRHHDLPQPRWGHRIECAGRRYEVDAWWPATMVVAELDGHRFHATPGELQRDSQRQNDLVMAGLTVLRLTFDDVTANASRTAALIRIAIERDAASPPSHDASRP